MRQPRGQRWVIGQRPSPQQLQQGLGHRPVGRAGGGWDCPARHDRHPPVGGHLPQLAYQARLADTRLASDDSAAALAGQRPGKRRLQRLDLGPPPHQDRAQHIPHDSSVPHRRQRRSVITRPTPAAPFRPPYIFACPVGEPSPAATSRAPSSLRSSATACDS